MWRRPKLGEQASPVEELSIELRLIPIALRFGQVSLVDRAAHNQIAVPFFVIATQRSVCRERVSFLNLEIRPT
jgi:hypothetical protein